MSNGFLHRPGSVRRVNTSGWIKGDIGVGSCFLVSKSNRTRIGNRGAFSRSRLPPVVLLDCVRWELPAPVFSPGDVITDICPLARLSLLVFLLPLSCHAGWGMPARGNKWRSRHTRLDSVPRT